MSLPTELPDDVRRRAMQPPGLPVGEPAWSQEDALTVLTVLEGTIIAVLQVDVYVRPFGRQELIHTGRRVSYDYRVGEQAVEFAVRSRELAAEFIAAGSRDELFVLLFSGQDDAEAGYGTVDLKAG